MAPSPPGLVLRGTRWGTSTDSIVSSSSCRLSPVSVAAQGSAYLLTHRSWTSRIGTGFRKWSFSRPRRRVTTRPASSSTRRCFMTPKRVIGSRASSALSVCPSSLKSSSSRRLRVGSARALNTASMAEMIGDLLVTYRAARLAGAWAGALAAIGLVLSANWVRELSHGYSEPFTIGLLLAAADAHLSGRRRTAIVLGGLVSLARPEALAL